MERLAQHGADLNRTNALGVPAWHGVLGQPSLLPYAEEPSLAYRVISSLPVPFAGLLQRVGVAPSVPQVRPESPLRLLQALGADWAATNGLGQTALHQVLLVRRARRAEVPVGFWGPPTATPGTVGQELVNPFLGGVQLLIDAGAALEARDQRGETPWLLAWRLIDTDVAHLLFQAGADTRAVNAEGMNALHLVCFDDVPKGDATHLVPRFLGPVIPHLVRQGVNPRATDAQGRTPLHFAVALRHPLFVAVELVEAGADPRARDHQGRTPLAMAEALGRSDLVAYFLDPAGAHPFPERAVQAP
ncbi:MAG: ankyrin repeat domain-containing protein [Verrucomicrobiales bacterium]|nr:ankyrin repeat domain-containing protein [Verrucomicrobiales bacterium]